MVELQKYYPQPERKLQDKEWGTEEIIFQNDTLCIHRIKINRGGKSTGGNFHKHRHKFNKFYVESGVLDIYVKSNNKDYYYQIGDDCEYYSVTVFPNNLHRFEAITDCIVYEIYWVTCNLGDIVRFDKNNKMVSFKKDK